MVNWAERVSDAGVPHGDAPPPRAADDRQAVDGRVQLVPRGLYLRLLHLHVLLVFRSDPGHPLAHLDPARA